LGSCALDHGPCLPQHGKRCEHGLRQHPSVASVRLGSHSHARSWFRSYASMHLVAR
jgi:hypothetical protein